MAAVLLLLLQAGFVLIAVLALTAGLSLLCARRWARRAQRDDAAPSIGFLHPHPLSGGGGERVLWVAVQAVSAAFPRSSVFVYGDFGGALLPGVIATVRNQFGLDLEPARFAPVDVGADTAGLVDPVHYPRLTLVRQAWGAAQFGLRAYCQRPSAVVLETGNFVFAAIGPRILGARTAAYVHYPTISSDMLTRVRERAVDVNNDAAVARSRALSALKLMYYRAFALLYAVAARAIDTAVANSSWTRGHLRTVWRRADVGLIFPPCPTLASSAAGARDPRLVVSLGQFRPEKDHTLQLSAFASLGARHPGHGLRLVMVGGARGESDRARAKALEADAERRGLPVEVRVNISREELANLLPQASIGLHTMRHEHFGISVVELQAAGLLVVAHRSGGVAQDILDDGRTGFLADGGADDYADRLWEARSALATDRGERMRRNATEAAARFSDKAFQEQFVLAVATVCGRQSTKDDQRSACVKRE